MQHLLQFGLSNAVAAAVLAVLAAVATRVWRNPHFAYALWLVVLLRLVAPPLLPVGVPVPEWMVGNSRAPLPAVSEPEKNVPPPADVSAFVARSTGEPQPSPVAPDRIARMATPSTAEFADRESNSIAQTPSPEDRRDPEGTPPRGSLGMVQEVSKGVSQLSASQQPSLANLVAVAWLSGTLCYLLLTALRVRRFSRVLRRARRDVSAGVAAEAAEVAAAVGLRRVPRLAFAEAALPPMVWPGWRSVVLLPKSLFASLGADARRLLLWHEFLHLRRRDHLVRWFEVAVVALYWWNPVAWWAVARLQGAEEDCCDAAVLVAHPHESARYGETLVSVAQFLSTGTLPTPSLSLGVARNHHIKRRLTMILHGPRWPELSNTRLAAFSLLGAALVAVTWTAAKAQTAPAAPAASVESPFAPKRGETAVADGLAKPQSERPAVQIDEILVEGNVRIPTADILQKLNLQTGRKVPQIRIDEGLYALMQTRQFFSVNPKYRRTDKKSTVTLVVAERPLMKTVSYLGAREFDTKSLAAVTQSEVGRPYNVSDNKEAVRRLESFYTNQGYTEATVELIKGDKPEDRDVVFRIHEGVGRKVVSSSFVGNNAVASERLAKVLKSSPVYVFSKGRLEPANVIGDVAAVRKYYADLGFFDATVTPKIEYGQNRGRVSLKYTVHEGEPYRIRHFSMTGNLRSKSDVLLKTIKSREGQFYDASQIREDVEKFKQAYEALEHTHLNVEIVPNFPQEPAFIDLLLRVEMAQNENGNSSLSMPGPRLAADVTPPANTSPTSSIRLSPTLTVPETRDVPLSQIKEMQPAAGDDELRKLQKERYNAALRELKLNESQYDNDTTRVSAVCQATRKLFEAWKALAQQPADELRAVDWYVGYTNRLWKGAHDRYLAGRASGFIWGGEAEARAARLEAEIESMKLRQGLASKISDETLGKLEGAAGNSAQTPPKRPSQAAPATAASAVKSPENNRKRWMDLKEIPVDPSDNEERKLLKERYNVTAEALDVYLRRSQLGELDWPTEIANVMSAALKVRDAELALCPDAKSKLAALGKYVDFARDLEKLAGRGWLKKDGDVADNMPLEAARIREAGLEMELKRAELRRELPQSNQQRIWTPTQPPQTPRTALPRLLTAGPVPIDAGDDERQKLLKERYNAALGSLKGVNKGRESDPTLTVSDLVTTTRQLLAAQVALARPQDLVGMYEGYIELMKYFESVVATSPAGAALPVPVVYQAEAIREARLEAEVKLAEARQAALNDHEKQPPAATGASPSTQPGAVEGAAKSVKPVPPIAKAFFERMPLLLTRPPLGRQARDDEWHKLLKERFNSAAVVLRVSYQRFALDQAATATKVIAAARRVLEADLALTIDPEFSKQEGQTALDAWQRYFELMKFLEQKAEIRFKAHIGGTDELEEVREARLDAELKLLEAQRAKSAPANFQVPGTWITR